jgi:hypothetical protein
MFARRCASGLSIFFVATALVGCSTPYVSSIQVTPAAITFVGPGGTAQMKAIGTFQQGEHTPWLEDITSQVTWTTNASGVVSVTKTGAVTGTGLGEAQITATMEGYKGIVFGIATITVCQPSPTLPGQCQISVNQ